jgi:hypothetical protein
VALRQAHGHVLGMRRSARRALWLQLGLAFLLIFVTLGAIPPPANASVPVPSLSVEPTSGPVGTVVTLRYSGDCDFGVMFGPVGDAGNDSLVGFSPIVRIVIPAFVGDPAVPVTKGDFEFGRTCNTPLTSSSFTNVFARFVVTGGASPERFVGMASTPDGGGYWLAQSNGSVYSFGDAHFFGSLPGLGDVPQAPIMGIVATSDGGGYWLVGADGGVFAFGDAVFHGSLPGIGVRPTDPIIGMAATSDGGGYWLSGADGGLFAFGDAPYCSPLILPPQLAAHSPPWPGTLVGAQSTVGMAAYPGSGGYATVVDTGIYGVVDPLAGPPCAAEGGRTSGVISLDTSLASPVSGIAVARDGGNVWLVGADGGVFAAPIIAEDVGTDTPSPPLAPFYGSLPGLGITPAAPIVGISATPDGKGYWLVGADGGVFSFGDAVFHGSAV